MNFAFTEEQEDLREAARAFLADHSSGEQVRHAMETEHGFDPDVWKRVGAELGFCGVTVPEEHGGIGLGSVELAGLMEVMGEHLLCAPFFSTVCLAGTALRIGGDEAQKQESPMRGEIRHRPKRGAMEPYGWTPAYYQVVCEKSSVRLETTWGS